MTLSSTQTTVTPWTDRCRAKCVHARFPECVLNPCRSLERSSDSFNPSERNLLDSSEHTLKRWWANTHALSGAPVISVWHWLHTEGTLTHSRRSVPQTYECAEPHVLLFSMP
ncbi:hypothetical protein XENOCAPTIV_001349 [Xenoophorus captivus]|uniref:Uncharacterized protein n=1 Tax=Xenoophorus captivus TaxID=1517983 RepID=A0ABV0S9T9_9TELE